VGAVLLTGGGSGGKVGEGSREEEAVWTHTKGCLVDGKIERGEKSDKNNERLEGDEATMTGERNPLPQRAT